MQAQSRKKQVTGKKIIGRNYHGRMAGQLPLPEIPGIFFAGCLQTSAILFLRDWNVSVFHGCFLRKSDAAF
jgi:hypothetical protein